MAVAGALGGLAIFAYRALLSYDPLAKSRAATDRVDDLFFSPTESDPTLIFILTALLLYQRQRQLHRAAVNAPSWVLGLPLMLAAAALCGWSYYVGAPELLVPSLSLTLLGAAAVWGGSVGLRAILVPALFLMLAYRPPGFVLNQIIPSLQHFTVVHAQSFLELTGYSSQASGNMIFTEWGTFHVIETCAGLRSIATLLMAAVIYAEVMNCSRIRSTLLVIASPLIGLVINDARVLSLVFNPYSSFASVHTAQGIAMIVVGVLAIAALDAGLKRALPAIAGPRRRRRLPKQRAVPSLRALAPRLAFISFVLVSTSIATSIIPVWTAERLRLPRLATFPVELEGWKVTEGLKLDSEFVGSTGFSQWVHRTYAKDDKQVTIFLASDDRLEPRASLISPRSAIPGPTWETVKRQTVELSEDGPVAEARLVRSPKGFALTLQWYHDIASSSEETLRSIFVLDRGPLRRPGRALVVRLTTPIGEDGPAAADRRQDEFLALTLAEVAKLLAS